MKELQKKQLELDKFIYESNNITDVGDISYNKIINFLIGLVVGGCFGVVIFSILAINRG